MTSDLTAQTVDGDDGARDLVRPVVTVVDKHVFVNPGESSRTTVSVRNVSGIVETYDIAVMGPAAPWATVQPPTVSLFPGDEATVTVSFRPPVSSAVVAGDYIVAIRAASQVAPECLATDETRVTVEPFYRYATNLARSTFQVRTKASAQVEVANRGNSTVEYAISAVDPENYVNIVIKSPEITLAPGEAVWVPIAVKVAPRPFGTMNDTRTINATIVPLRNADSGMPIVEPEIETQYINLLHRPLIKLRMGFFAKFLLLIGLLALVSAFFFTRWLANQAPPATEAPEVPVGFLATLNESNQPVLTWDSSSGATSYVIYAIGSAGDPVPEPTVAVSPAARRATSLRMVPAVAPAPRATSMASPQPGDESLPSPICVGCVELATVDGGTTRYVVEQANPGEACYRMAAKSGEIQSLFSSPTCVMVRSAEEQAVVEAEAAAAAAAASGSDAAEDPAAQPAPPVPCAPVRTDARAVSPTAVAVLWQAATAPPKGWTAPAPSASPSAPATVRGGDPDAKTDDGPTASDAKVCDPAATITGWSIQRKIFTGWSDVSPEAKPNDTAIEVTGLEPDTKYCFRMAAKSANGDSKYTKKFCVTTPGAVPVDPLPDSTAPTLPSTDMPVTSTPA